MYLLKILAFEPTRSQSHTKAEENWERERWPSPSAGTPGAVLASPENIHTSSIRQTEQAVFRNANAYSYAYMHE